MDNPVPLPRSPAASGWDIGFTRLAREVQSRIEAIVQELTPRWRAAGLGCDVQVRQTPRGLSTFVAVIGQRGLLCIVDMTLIDGMAVAREPGAALDIRLLDACGDCAARGSPRLLEGESAYRTTADGVLAASQVGPCATAVYVLAMGHFGLPTAAPLGTERAVPR
jgi:hypothetical protein